eukprot:gnl/TRDRNA2_/TRDRNA2_173457_c0_seq1.p1 gnl/TRDRNA2_/TRDRNA2_173457_c0~~gnl/TRDRNA2_/TRDRNA2_173457_c0_seq1.p1  ORF type:complete len:402 (+),score=39.92 gnl/TRDRNA2_/TRDRNA2_173457_c0_seq1:66-1271(+)
MRSIAVTLFFSSVAFVHTQEASNDPAASTATNANAVWLARHIAHESSHPSTHSCTEATLDGISLLRLTNWTRKEHVEAPPTDATMYAGKSDCTLQDEDEDAQHESILPQLAALPLNISSQATKRNKNSARRVAVCMTGHLRTFPWIGVHSSIAKFLMRGIPGEVDVDLYLYGHFGAFGNDRRSQRCKSEGPMNASDPALIRALGYKGLNLKYVELHPTGSKEDWEHVEGVKAPRIHNGAVVQWLWLDRCIRKTRAVTPPYDIVVRTRPDLAMCKPLQWEAVSDRRINYKPGGKLANDEFFTIPKLFLDAYGDQLFRQLSWVDVRHEARHDNATSQNSGLGSEKVFAAQIVRRQGLTAKRNHVISCRLPNSAWPNFKAFNTSEAMLVASPSKVAWAAFGHSS